MRTRILLASLLAVGGVAPSGVLTPAHASPRPHHRAMVIHQHLVRLGRRALVTHSGSTKEFDQNLVGGGELVPVTSSTGLPLSLGVFMDQYGSGGGSETDLEINVVNDQGQDDLWDITVRDRGLIYDPLSGQGQIRVAPSDIAPFGRVHLDISPAGPATKTQCANGASRVVRPIQMRGTLVFDTKFDAWGSVGDPVDQIVFDKHEVAESDYGQVTDACAGFTPPRCHGDFQVMKGGLNRFLEAVTYGRRGDLHASMFFDHMRQLPDGLNGFADDFVDQDIPTPRLTHGRKPTVVLDAGTTGLITGSATWTAVGKPQLEHGICRKGTTTEWQATFANGAAPLTATLSTGGVFTFSQSKRYSYLSLDSSAPKSAGASATR